MRLDRKLLASPRLTALGGRLLGRYIRFVYDSARLSFDPPDAFDRLRAEAPAILAFWHGQAMMAPAARPLDLPTITMIARNAAAGVVAYGAETQGLPSIRASGAHGRRSALRKGGATGFRQALRALESGTSVLMTADVPKVGHQAGRGIVELARLSGRPIVPVVYVSRRAIRLRTWDRLSIDLPFSRAVVAHGDPIRIAREADGETVEETRQALTLALDRLGERAYHSLGLAPPSLPDRPIDG